MKAKIGLFALLFCFTSLIPSSQEDTVKKVNALLDFSMEELMNVAVVSASASVSAQKLSEAPSTMFIIAAQQIEERGYEELGDALRDIPGIDFNHLNGYSPTLICFRGMYGAENLRALLLVTIKNLFNVNYLDPGIRSADGMLYSTVLEQPGITAIFKITASF